MTLETVKDKILEKIAELVKDNQTAELATGWANVYGMLCSTEGICKCPSQNEFPTDLGEQ